MNGEGFTKEPSVIEQKAYRDTWGKGVNSYLQWLYETVCLLRELLKSDGTFFLHLDWHVGHSAKIVMDEIFGTDNFVNEIIWQRSAPKGLTYNRFPNTHDVILFYANGPKFVWNKAFGEYRDEHLAKFRYVEEGTGRRYMMDNVQNPNPDRPNLTYEWNGVTKVWRWTKEKMHEMHNAGRLEYSRTGVPYYKRYIDEMPGATITDTWTDISPVNSQAIERLGFPTQKPEALLERIIKTSSSEGDIVLDCFVGSGTTAAVAEKLNRRWIACDLGRFAIHTTRKRLLSMPDVKPFVVQNLGKYERQLWQAAEFGEQAEQRTQEYRRFILELHHAQPVTGYAWLHGVKAGRMVHVGAVDSPVSPGDIAQIAAEFKRAVGTGKDAPKTNGVDVLGWDFAFELNEVAKQQAAQANINMRFLRIPREVLEKKAVEQGDIRFFELAALSVDMTQKGRSITLKLTDFVIPPDDVPEDVRRAITHWEQWVDYWAVDWNNRGDTFHNEWQDYRTRKKRELQKVTSHTYEQPGTYIIVVKVIDILGNDTTKTLKVEVH